MLRRIHENIHLVNPFEVAIALMFFISGLGLLLVAPDPASIVSVFPDIIRFSWAVLLTAGGGLKLSGILSNNISFRRAGLALMGGSCSVYAIALVTYGGMSAFFPICLVMGVTWACWSMYRRLR